MAYRKLKPKPGKCLNCPPCINPGDMLKIGLEHCIECCKMDLNGVSTPKGVGTNSPSNGIDKKT